MYVLIKDFEMNKKNTVVAFETQCYNVLWNFISSLNNTFLSAFLLLSPGEFHSNLDPYANKLSASLKNVVLHFVTSFITIVDLNIYFHNY